MEPRRTETSNTEEGAPSFGMLLAVGVVVVWAALGPMFDYSDTWQLVINTGTTVVTFLMVFLIQRTQNKDALAIHIKLNELVAAVEGASNRLVDIEALTESERPLPMVARQMAGRASFQSTTETAPRAVLSAPIER